ncbi:hypothetical protein FIBSPDRAFT_925750 [Athelia psychrophila]|uniref:MARVEL domain-containing protein n=1 Tax=Athelia psychrophila TaxID=1759441 RepID=A0A166UAY3_9AGAM|nr:hypothetical protein FIBSPDRAFT_925750 [Fibularhizoctonia sp. CBS 109695]
MQTPVQISDLAARSDGSSFSIILRLITLALSVVLLIISIPQFSIAHYWWFFIPSTVYLTWQTCILVLAHRGVKIAPPVALTLDLLMWLSAVAFIMLSYMFYDGFIYMCDDWLDPCQPYWTFLRLWIAGQVITGLIGAIHLVLFIRDIMVLRRAKRAAAKNVELVDRSHAA